MTDNDKVKAAQALGKAITMRRTEMGMKRTKLAERAALSYPYLSEIENGRKMPSAEKLRSLALALKMNVVDLMGLAEVYEDDEAGVGSASVVSMSRTARSRPSGLFEDDVLEDGVAAFRSAESSSVSASFEVSESFSFDDLGEAPLAPVNRDVDGRVSGHRHSADPDVPTGVAAISEDAIRQIVRSELERWAVDVLPILMRQEIRRFLDDDLR